MSTPPFGAVDDAALLALYKRKAAVAEAQVAAVVALLDRRDADAAFYGARYGGLSVGEVRAAMAVAARQMDDPAPSEGPSRG